MSDPSGYEDVLDLNNDNPDPQQPNQQRDDYLVRVPRSQIRQVQDKAKKAGDAEARAEALERELAFTKAGVDIDSEDGALFARGYDGKLETEDIKAAASKFNLSQPAPPAEEEGAETETEETPDTQLEEGEASLANDRQALAENAPPDNQAPTDPYKEAGRVHETAINAGAPEKVAVGGAINALVNAANRGDQRVVLDKRGHAKES